MNVKERKKERKKTVVIMKKEWKRGRIKLSWKEGDRLRYGRKNKNCILSDRQKERKKERKVVLYEIFYQKFHRKLTLYSKQSIMILMTELFTRRVLVGKPVSYIIPTVVILNLTGHVTTVALFQCKLCLVPVIVWRLTNSSHESVHLFLNWQVLYWCSHLPN